MLEFLITLVVLAGAAFLGSFRQGNRAFVNVMLIYSVCLTLAIIISLYGSVGSTLWETPYLAGSDGEQYFEQARLLAQGGILDFADLIRSNYLGYQIILATLFVIFSPTLLTGLILNEVMLIVSASVLYRATLLVTESPRAAFYSVIAMMFTSTHIFYGLALLKEPTLSLAFSLLLLVIAQTVQGRQIRLQAAAYMLTAFLLIVMTRATAFAFVFLVLAFVGSLVIRRRVYLLVMFLGLAILILPLAQSFSLHEFNAAFLVETVADNRVISSRLEQGDLDVSGIAGQFGSRYVAFPFPVKVALFPLPTFVQMAIPFDFWSGQFITDHPAVFFYKNLNILWSLIVLPWFLFSLINIRRIQIPVVTRFLLAGTAYYIIIAIMYGGLIPRYVAPSLFFIYPAIGYWWARSRAEGDVGARVSRFFGQYYVLFVFAGLAYLALQLMRG